MSLYVLARVLYFVLAKISQTMGLLKWDFIQAKKIVKKNFVYILLHCFFHDAENPQFSTGYSIFFTGFKILEAFDEIYQNNSAFLV